MSPAEAYLTMLKNFEPYAESVWSDYPAIEGTGYFGDGNSGGNGGIRGTCGIILAYAVLVDAYPDAVETPRRLARIKAGLPFVARTHHVGPEDATAVNGKKWGRSWQSGLWAGTMGLAAFLVQELLPESLLAECKAVLADEADYRSGIPPASGYKGNTRAEENAWNSNVPSLASAWLAGHSHQMQWLKTAQRYLINTYTVAADKDGPMAKWITTVNLYPSYMLENHGFYHPSYHMVAGMSMGDSYLMAKLVNPKIAQSLCSFAEHNVMNVWKVLEHIVQLNGDFLYPSGMDWALHSYGQVSYYAFLATHFNDGRAALAEGQLIERLLERQKVNSDGRFVGESLENGFYSEAIRARRIAFAWLHHKTNNFERITPVPFLEAFTKRFDDVGIIAHKSTNGFSAVSYDSRIMMLVVPTPGDMLETNHVVAPQIGSLVGDTVLGKATTADLIKYRTFDNGFQLLLKVKTDQGVVYYDILSCPDAVVLIQTPKLGKVEAKINEDCFSIAFENHPLTGGVRHVQATSKHYKVPQMSGERFEIKSSWCCISEKLGIIFGPAGLARYRSSSGYNRKGAAVDYLTYQPNQPLEPTYVVLLPNQNAETTKRIHSGVEWSRFENQMRLTCIRPGGQRIEMSSQPLLTVQ